MNDPLIGLGVWFIMVCMVFFIAPSLSSIAKSLKKMADE